MNEENKRRHERIKLPYVIKYQSVQSESGEHWDSVVPVNMSESGICFLTMEKYMAGTGMKLLVTDPIKKNEYMFDCIVLRCVKSKTRPMFHETVVTIEEISDNTRKMFVNLLKAFKGETTEE